MIGGADIGVQEVAKQLATVGMSLVANDAHQAIFASKTHSLVFATEPHYPGVSASLRTTNGHVFELGLLAQLLSPRWYSAQLKEARALPNDDLKARHAIVGVVNFIEAHSAQIFEDPPSYLAAYQEASKLRRAKLGLP